MRDVRIVNTVPITTAAGRDAGRLALVQVNYVDSAPEIYQLPLQIAPVEEAERFTAGAPTAVIGRLGGSLLFDALYDEAFRVALFEVIVGQSRISTPGGTLVGMRGQGMAGGNPETPVSRVLKAEQSNSSVLYGDKYFLKLYRKLDDGVNPDAELIQFLSERQKFGPVPTYCGAIERHPAKAPAQVLALLVAQVPNVGDAWAYTLDSLGRFFERVLALKASHPDVSDPVIFDEVMGGIYPERVELLARRTGEMHLALAGDRKDPAFAPEPLTGFALRSLYQTMRGQTKRCMQLLKKKQHTVPEKYREEVTVALKLENEILRRQARLYQGRISATRTRTHGDYHLGQVLNTEKDFVITDFEGEPARPLSERKMKRSPMRDVAGILRSFHYAIHTALMQQPVVRAEDAEFLRPWAEKSVQWSEQTFLNTYYETTKGASFIPEDPAARAILLESHLLEKAVYEVMYELNNRPDWISIPLQGIRRLVESDS
ncbi:MAG: putative maltokinase [Chthoniobacteraceae bacterium]